MTVAQYASRTLPLRATLVAAISIALLGVVAVSSAFYDAMRSRRSTPAIATEHVSEATEVAATMKIVPADVLDHGAQSFVGTGDGNTGFWKP